MTNQVNLTLYKTETDLKRYPLVKSSILDFRAIIVTLVAHAVFVRVLCPKKKLFANKLVEGLGTIFGWVHISHTRHFWPKGKKYILKNIKKKLCFL